MMNLIMDFLFAAKGTLSEDTIRLFLRQLGKKINYVIIDTQNDGHPNLSKMCVPTTMIDK